MKCPFCSSRTKVYNSRSSHQSTQTWRRRECLACRKAFTTREKVDFDSLVSIKNKNASKTSPYSSGRLLISIIRASSQLSLPSEAAIELSDSIELELKNARFFDDSKPRESIEITETAIKIISRYDTHLALAYINNVFKGNPPLEILQNIVNKNGSGSHNKS